MRQKPPPFLLALLDEPEQPHRLVNRRLGSVVANQVSGAFDSRARRTGLLGQTAMAPGTALIIAPTNAIHTFFMAFDIDAAFVDREGRVVKISSRLRPWRVAAAFSAFGVIEMAAGSLHASGTEIDDILWCSRDEL